MNFEAKSLTVDNFIAELRNSRFLAAAKTRARKAPDKSGNSNSLFSGGSANIYTAEVFGTKALCKKILDTYQIWPNMAK